MKDDKANQSRNEKEEKIEKKELARYESNIAKLTDVELLKTLSDKDEGELCLVSTVIGCRESKDRIEFSMHLKEFVAREDAKEKDNLSEKDKKEEEKEEKKEYKIIISEGAKNFIRIATVR